MTNKKCLQNLTKAELTAQLAAWGEPKYRAAQIWKWVYESLCTDFAEMTNLPRALRTKLEENYTVTALKLLTEQISRNKQTRKVLLELADGNTIEAVLMNYESRRTVCVSSQVGCAIGCPFCATGLGGLTRNLSAGEIVEQVLYFARQLAAQKRGAARVTNIVIMGMGEPFANYDAVWQAIETWNDATGFNLGARHITISTAGLVPGILRLSEEPLQVGLSISLHASSDALRDKLVPINKQYPIAKLLHACRVYISRTNRRVSFEYILLEGVNDSIAQARELARLLRGMLCHVNLIPLNAVKGSKYRAPAPQKIQAFQDELLRLNIPTTPRLSRGADIKAACGQLRGSSKT